MRTEIDAQMLTIYIGADDTYQGKLLSSALVDMLKGAGLAGATVIQAHEGFGAHHRLHTARFESLFLNLPVIIETIDERGKIADVLPVLDTMIEEGLVTLTDVKAIHYIK